MKNFILFFFLIQAFIVLYLHHCEHFTVKQKINMLPKNFYQLNEFSFPKIYYEAGQWYKWLYRYNFWWYNHPIFTKGYFAKSTRIALSRYQDELLMCLCAGDECAKSDTILPVSKRMPSVKTNVLISDVFTESSVLTKKCNFKLEFGLTHVKILQRNRAKELLSCLYQR